MKYYYKEYKKKYYKENSEKIKKTAELWRRNNMDKATEHVVKWQNKNRLQILMYHQLVNIAKKDGLWL